MELIPGCFRCLLILLLTIIDLASGQTVVFPAACNLSLVQDLSDELFTASSQYSDEYSPSHAKSDRNGWAARVRSSEEYLQLNFNRTVEISGLRLSQNARGWYSKSVRLSFSQDGRVWHAYNSRLSEEVLGDLIAETSSKMIEILLDPSIKAQYMAINPVQTYSYPSMRLEVFGCDVTTPPPLIGTEVTRNVEGDVEWIPSQSPYVISDVVSIATAGSVTIQAGVTVVFMSENAGINVYGKLTTRGIPGLNVVFTSNHPVVSAKDKWAGIKQEATGTTSLVQSTIRQAVAGITGNGTRLTLDGCLIHSCDNGVQLNSGIELPEQLSGPEDVNPNMIMVNNTVSVYNDIGILLQGTSSHPFFFIHNSLVGKSTIGIRVQLWDRPVSDTKSTAVLLSQSAVVDNTGNCVYTDISATVYVINTNISGNNGFGIYMYAQYYGNSLTLIVGGSLFIRNQRGLYLYCRGCDSSSYVIQNSTFVSTHVYAYFLAHDGQDQKAYGRFIATNNSFTAIPSYIPMHIQLYDSDFINIDFNMFNSTNKAVEFYRNKAPPTDAFVTNNKFINVYGENVLNHRANNMTVHFVNNIIFNTTATNVLNGETGNMIVRSNNFTVNERSTACYVKVGKPYELEGGFLVDENYWGTPNLINAKRKICDFFLDSTKSRVYLKSFYNSSDMTSLVQVPNSDTFTTYYDPVEKAYIAGGIIYDDITLNASMFSDPILVNRSIEIREGGSLTVTGLNLNFTESRGFAVHGNLSIGTKKGALTVLRSHIPGKKWNGVGLFTSDITIENAKINGTNVLIQTKTAFNVTIVNSSVYEGNTFLLAEEHIGDVNITIVASIIDVKNYMIRLLNSETNHTNIVFINSTLRSNYLSVLFLDEIIKSKHFAKTNVRVLNSDLFAGNTGLYIMSCMSYLVFYVNNSTFSAGSAAIWSKFFLADFGVYDNRFERYNNGIDFSYCSGSHAFVNYDRKVEIIGNLFNGPNYGRIIYLYNYNERKPTHEFYIANNTFNDQSSRRQAIDIYQRSPYVSHTFLIKNNLFKQLETGIRVRGFNEDVLIEDNIFENGKKCVDADSEWYTFNNFSFRSNIVRNNTYDGVVTLKLKNKAEYNFDITDNWFFNNTGNVVSFFYPQITLKHNFFENTTDGYNIHVQKDSTSYADQYVNASLNYWGSDEVGAIANTIYDKDFDDTLLDVIFRPYLASKNTSDVQDGKEKFIKDSGEIGGTVGGDVVLTRDGSPYKVVSNIVVQETDSLTLELGTTLLFSANLGIKVEGILYVAGKPDAPVVFTSQVSGEPWKGIDISGSRTSSLAHLVVNETLEGVSIRSYAAVTNVTSWYSSKNGITMNIQNIPTETSHIDFKGLHAYHSGGYGIVLDLLDKGANETTVNVDGCTASNNSYDGVYIKANATVTFRNCTVHWNKNSGFYIHQKNGGTMNISTSSIESNTATAVYIEVTKRFIFRSNTVSKNIRYWRYTNAILYFSMHSFYTNALFSISISNNTFENNTMHAIVLHTKFRFNLDLQNNKFIRGWTILYFTPNIRHYNTLTIRFSGNTVSDNSYAGPLVQIASTHSPNMTINITNNTLFRNEIENAFMLGTSEKIDAENILVKGNTFSNNTVSKAFFEIYSHPILNIHNNVFDNFGDNKSPVRSTTCEIRAPLFNNATYYINATHNYWGTRQVSDVIEKVCGFDQRMDRSFVYYMPYYTSESLNRLIALEHAVFDITGAVGGEITRETTLSRATSTGGFVIGRSIMIRNGSRLIVEQGMKLAFKSGRGIYAAGGLNLLGDGGLVNLTSALPPHESWYGVVLDSNTDVPVISNTSIENTEHGLEVLSNTFEIRSSRLQNSLSDCLKMPLGPDRIFDLQGTQLRNCSKAGLAITGTGNLTVVNVTVQDAYTCVDCLADYGHLVLSSSAINNCQDSGVAVHFTSSYNSGNVTIENCEISNCAKGIDVSVLNYRKENDIKISRNVLRNISVKAMEIDFSNSYSAYNVHKQVDVSYNTFYNACFISLTCKNYVNISFHDNVISNSSCVDPKSDTYYLTVHADGNRDIWWRVFDVSYNVFNNVTSTYTAWLQGDYYDHIFTGSLNSNHFLDNKASKGIVLVDTKHFSIHENIFDSPASLFDVYVQFEGSEFVNASHNWWGSTDLDTVYTRIYDGRQNYDLLTLNVTPIATQRTVDCTGVSNCSSHGECVSRDRCRCHTGWKGKTCDLIDCSGVNDCYGNGICVGPNTCQCRDGWSGSLCIIASCGNVNACSGHGICVRPDMCVCADRFTGSDCASCEPLHWGELCQPCPACVHGQCDLDKGICVCDSSNWAGQLCDTCSETFYGPYCLPLMMALTIIPSAGLDTGGNTVHVWGHNFAEPTADQQYTCKFDADVVNGTWLAWNHVTCPVPQHEEGTVDVEISPDGVSYTNNELLYTFYATCPPGSCGRDFTPSRGQCLFGGCSCNLPWAGESCAIELLAPVITAPPQQENITESSYYTYQLSLEQGEQPVRWKLVSGPPRMTIIERKAMVEWDYAMSSPNSYTIKVEASNIIGSHTVQWDLLVPISYSVTVTSITPSGELPVPKPIIIKGEVTFSDGVPRVVPVDIEVRHNNRVRKLFQIYTDPLNPKPFTVTYYPRSDEAGRFTALARHPASDGTGSAELSWEVQGMLCNPGYINWHGKIDGDVLTYHNISTLINTGGLPVNNISARVDGLSDAYVRKAGWSSTSGPFLDQLPADGSQLFDFVVENPRPLSGTIYLTFTSAEGLTTRLKLRIRLSVRKPVLVFTPSSLGGSISRGTQKIFNVQVENRGEVPARNVKADLPNDRRISLAAFSYVNEDDEASNDEESTSELIIPAQGKAAMTISVIIDPSENLGEMSGRIAVNTNLTYGYISYRFFITSIQTLTLNVTVTDEYSYFASDKPKVAGAKVQLTNPRRNYNEIRYTTNDTEGVQFEDIYEDKYTLNVQADDHSSYSAVIIASPDNAQHEAFLKRTAVKYEWTVTPTVVKDTYVITLESTFETFVPMPVVTIEPAKVNTIPYELGQKDTIEFVISNYGLVRVDNLRYILPTSHPYLDFESDIESLDHLDANTTVIMPVRTKLKPARRRRSSFGRAAVCGLAMVYELDCGGIQSYNRDVTLTRETPGRPPHPCRYGDGGGGGGGGGGAGGGGSVTSSGGGSRGSGSGTVVEYNPVTPLSCDCAKTLVKSCLIAFNPILGCANALADLGLSLTPKKTGGSKIVGALNVILGLADSAFSCVFGAICTPCGLLYTAVRCYIDVKYSSCNKSRQRRDVSSDVVNNLLDVAVPMDNFLTIMAEVLGDENMYDIGRDWYGTFKTAVADDSDNGSSLSGAEVATILNVMAEEAKKATLNKFLMRWNNTVSAYDNGTLTEMTDNPDVINLSTLTPLVEQYANDINTAKEKGYNSIFDEFDNAVGTYTTAEEESKKSGNKKDDTCAKVRVRIVQELVLTRDAFNARLEIENGESSPLEDIAVEIHIRQTYGDGTLANEKFSIGSPSLVGISAVDGTGRLGQDLSGVAEWLIMPYSSAAPREDILYDFGGQLSYRVGSSEFSVPLLPDTLTVKSNPSLVVHYFHDKYVLGDDPFTPDIVEQTVPFSLCVMIMNAGYGVANALKISSAQPEIIENEKGLLVSFKIIGAQLGDNPISPSLTVDFGDINSFETKTARWLLTSTLQGTFYNYSATFENINPLGDPQLSVLDELGYHELVHLVRIEDSDDLDDFLVNDVIDDEAMPDKLYNSANGTDVYDVSIANGTIYFVNTTTRSSGRKSYTIIYLNVSMDVDNKWNYMRIENNITSASPGDDQHFLSALRDYDKYILLDKNVWQTTHISDTFYIHLLDTSDDLKEDRTWAAYSLWYGPRNMYPPKFNSTFYSANVPANAQAQTHVLTVDAYDLDKDDVIFYKDNFEPFDIVQESNYTGVILLNGTIAVGDRYEFVVTVTDKGIPSKSSTVTVSITVVVDQGSTSFTTPTTTTKSTSTSTESTSSFTPTTTSDSTSPPNTTLSISTSVSTSSTTMSTTAAPNTTASSSSSSTSSIATSSSTTASTMSSSSTPTSTSTESTSSLSTSASTTTENLTSESTPSPTTTSTVSSSSSTPPKSTSSETPTTTSSTKSTTSVSTKSTNTTSVTSSTVSSAASTSFTTDAPTSSSTANVTTEEEQGGLPRYAIPAIVGGAVAVVVVAFIIGFVYALRHQGAPGMPRSASYNLH